MLLPVSRWAAFFIHLLISALIFFALVVFMLAWFFPGALFQVAGGWEGVRIIALVDLVLGPCLTLIVFNSRKPKAELVRDLFLIGLVQVAALVGGLYAVSLARPLAVVYVFDTLYVFNQEDYQQMDVAPELVAKLSNWGPRFFYVEVPMARADFLSQHVKGLLNGEKHLQGQVELYRPMPTKKKDIERILINASKEGDNCWRVDIESIYRQGSVCIDSKRGELSDFKETVEKTSVAY